MNDDVKDQIYCELLNVSFIYSTSLVHQGCFPAVKFGRVEGAAREKVIDKCLKN